MTDKLRVVASYTTLPSRYEVLQQSLQSIKFQTHKVDAIYLSIPKISRRLNKSYPPLPDEITKVCTVVYSDVDYGPLTKIYGALMSETYPDTIIISCDDDVLFEANHIEKLLEHYIKCPGTVICGTGALIGKGLLFISIVENIAPFHNWKGTTGFEVPNEGRNVDLIFGASGVLYTRGMFPSKESVHEELFNYALLDEAIFCNDDVLISGYLSKCDIERKVFLDIPPVKSLNGDDALSANKLLTINRLNKSIDKVKEYGFYTTMEHYGYNETPAGRIFIAGILFIIIIILCVYLVK